MGYEEFCQHLELCTEKVVVVHLADGDTITTRIHGTDEDIRAYYRVGSVLNMGAERDRLVEVVAVDIIESPGNAPHGPVNELQRQEYSAEVSVCLPFPKSRFCAFWLFLSPKTKSPLYRIFLHRGPHTFYLFILSTYSLLDAALPPALPGSQRIYTACVRWRLPG